MKKVIISAAVLLGAMSLNGCDGSSKTSPPTQLIESTVGVKLPAYVKVAVAEVDPVASTGASGIFNYKVMLTAKEDLYVLDRTVTGEPTVYLLKKANAAGAAFPLYGKISASRMVDKWETAEPEVDGISQLGKPRASFGADGYLTDSPEAVTALKQQEANAKAKAAKIIADMHAAESARIEAAKIAAVREAERQEKLAAWTSKLKAACTPNRQYLGSVVDQGRVKKILIQFTSVSDSLVIEAVFADPDNPQGDNRKFVGKLNPELDDKGDDEAKESSIYLYSETKAICTNGFPGLFADNRMPTKIKLSLTSTGGLTGFWCGQYGGWENNKRTISVAPISQ